MDIPDSHRAARGGIGAVGNEILLESLLQGNHIGSAFGIATVALRRRITGNGKTGQERNQRDGNQ